jgi:hypothetical protein
MAIAGTFFDSMCKDGQGSISWKSDLTNLFKRCRFEPIIDRIVIFRLHQGLDA